MSNVQRIMYAGSTPVSTPIAADLYVGHPADEDNRLVLVLDGVRYDITPLALQMQERLNQLHHLVPCTPDTPCAIYPWCADHRGVAERHAAHEKKAP